MLVHSVQAFGPCCRTGRNVRQAVVAKCTLRHLTHEQVQLPSWETSTKLHSRRELVAFVAAIAGLSVGPLGHAKSSTGDEVTVAAQAVQAIRRDFVDRQYYVTGDLTPELFDSNCVFKDPTVEVTGVEPYARALQTLFDPATSRADLISLRVTSPSTVELRWRLEGSLKLGGLRIKPYTGTTVYTIADNGKVVRHEETWDISTLDAFVSTFIPSFGAPPAPPVATSAST